MTTFAASMVPRDLPGSGWYEILPAPPAPRVLEGDISADWVVVGAGFAGLAAARRLAQLRDGDKIVVLDAQPVGFGSAGRNSGFMIDLPHELNSENYAGGLEADREQIAMNRAAIDFAREVVAEYGLSDCFNPCGKYHGASNAHGLKALAEFERHLGRLGEPYEHLDAADLRRITGTSFYLGGSYTPGAVILQPAAYIRGFAQGLSRQVALYENSPVWEIQTDGGLKVITPQGSGRAGKVILTVNGHLESFGLFARRLLHIFTYASMTQAMSDRQIRALGGEKEWALIPADPMGTTVRRTRDNRIVIRNSVTFNPQKATNDAQVAKCGRQHDRSFAARFPMLTGLEMAYRWGGLLCASTNSVPAFGEIEKGVFAAGCQNALGVCKGTFHGKLIAELATGQQSDFLSKVAALAAPKRLPPEPFLSIGARLHLWHQQKKAGSDL